MLFNDMCFVRVKQMFIHGTSNLSHAKFSIKFSTLLGYF